MRLRQQEFDIWRVNSEEALPLMKKWAVVVKGNAAEVHLTAENLVGIVQAQYDADTLSSEEKTEWDADREAVEEAVTGLAEILPGR